MSTVKKVIAGAAVLLLVLVAVVVLSRLACYGRRPPGPPAPPDTAPAEDVLHGAPSARVPHGLPAIVIETVTVHATVSREYVDTALAGRYARLASEYRRWRIKAAQDSLARARGDSVPPDTTPRPADILPPVRGRYDGRTLSLWLTKSSGWVLLAQGRVKPTWEFTAGRGGRSDQVPTLDQSRYFARATKRTVRCLPRAAVLGGTGYVTMPANRWGAFALAAGATIAGCLLE